MIPSVLLWLALLLQAPMRRPPTLAPISLATGASGQLVILDRSGAIFTLDTNEEKSGLRQIVSLPPHAVPAAVEAGSRRDSFFALVRYGTFRSPLCEVLEYSSHGEPLGKWSIPFSTCEGLAFDASRSYLYITDSAQNRILRLNIAAAKAAPEPWILPGAGRLGAIAFAGQVLYVADGLKRRVFMVHLANWSPKSLSPGKQLSDPLGLAFDQSTGRLYVADEHHDVVWRINVKSPASDWERFLDVKAFRKFDNRLLNAGDPVSVALDPHGRLWIGDTSAQAVIAVEINSSCVLRVLR